MNNFIKVNMLKVSSGVLIIGLSAKYLYSWLTQIRENQRLIIFEKQLQNERELHLKQMEEEFSENSEEFDKITKLNLKQLKNELFKRELLAEHVLRAFITKAMELQAKFNCIIEFIPNAMTKAKELDKMHMVKGPLHGIPFCVQADIPLESKSFNKIDNSSKNDSSAVIIKCLEDLGAVAFCRTTLNNFYESEMNFIETTTSSTFGKTLNPLNKKFGVGGSGTACLISVGGSPFGIGTDDQGSLRISAHLCGISVLKPTGNRLSRRGLTTEISSQKFPGILAKSAEEVALIFQSLTDNNFQNKIDGKTVPIPWNCQTFESKRKLRIGYLKSVPRFIPIGDIESVILRAKTFLESTGHILIPFKIPFDPSVCVKICGNSSKSRPLTPWNNSLKNILVYSWRNLSEYTIDYFKSHVRHEVKFIWRRDDLADRILDKMKEDELDLILSPVFPFPMILLHQLPSFLEGSIYTLIWNILDFPVGVVKVWTESGRNWKCNFEDEENSKFHYNVVGNIGGDEINGMPIGLQIIGRPFHEELLLKTMFDLDEINQPTESPITTITKQTNSKRKISNGCWQ